MSERELDEPGGKSEQLEDRSVGRCATTTGRCGRGKEESWRKSFSEEGLSDCVLKRGTIYCDAVLQTRSCFAQNISVSEMCTNCVHPSLPPPKLVCSTNLLVFLVSLLCNQLRLCQLGLQDCDAVVLHVVLVLQRLPYPAPPVKSNSSSSQTQTRLCEEICTFSISDCGLSGEIETGSGNTGCPSAAFHPQQRNRAGAHLESFKTA